MTTGIGAPLAGSYYTLSSVAAVVIGGVSLAGGRGGLVGPVIAAVLLTLAPMDRSLVDLALMSPAEIAWLDAYHARVLAEIGPLVPADTAAWLAEVTRPLA